MTVDAPRSPCINVCSLDEHEICRGCFRSLQEIGAWTRLSPQEQWQVVERAEQRRRVALQAARGAGS